MIPPTLTSLVEKQPGEVRRVKHAEARSAIEELGIAPDSEFAEFYLAYKVGNFIFGRPGTSTLCDLAEPTRQISGETQSIREVWELPDQFVCIPLCEGEGAYLYDKVTGQVFDFGLDIRDDFLSGRIRREEKWSGIFAFMTWYWGAESSCGRCQRALSEWSNRRSKRNNPAVGDVVAMPVSTGRPANAMPDVRCLDRWPPVSRLQKWERTTAR